MNLSQILKALNDKERDFLVLDRKEIDTLQVYITQLEKVIKKELKWI